MRWAPRPSSICSASFGAEGSRIAAPRTQTGEMPNMIWLYRRPLLDYWSDGQDTLGEVVTHVLVHEIGHHFGLSDDDMAAIERQAG